MYECFHRVVLFLILRLEDIPSRIILPRTLYVISVVQNLIFKSKIIIAYNVLGKTMRQGMSSNHKTRKRTTLWQQVYAISISKLKTAFVSQLWKDFKIPAE